MIMTRKAVGKTNRILSGYCLVVAESAEGKIKLFGSPAEQASVDAGDEILEVNGKKLDESSHNDVIDHIHQSIKSRRVSLKVRRRRGKRLADEFPTYSIQNAYIVSSDDQVHHNVDLLPHENGPIQPIVMSSLLFEPEPETRLDEEIDIPDAKLNIGLSLRSASQTFDTLEPIQEPSESPPPEVEFIRPLSAHEQHRSIEDLLQRTLRNIDTCIQLSKKQEGSDFERRISRNVSKALKDSSADFCFNYSSSRRPASFCPGLLASEETSRISSSMPSSDSAVDMGTQIQYSMGREMAIDVPDQFTGTVKRPLRYPNTNDVSTDLHAPSAAMQEAERIKRYQAEIRRRTEEEQLKAKKDEFMRTSLRNSTRLKALEKNSRLPAPAPPGFFNAAFEDERTAQSDFPVALDGQDSDIIDVPDSQSMKEALDQIAAVLKNESSEFAAELDFIESLFDNETFRNAADLHHFMESHQLALTEPVTTQAKALTDTMQKLLPSCMRRDAQELEAILSTPQFENLILTHDNLAVQMIELAQLHPSPVQDFNTNDRVRTEGGNSSFHSDAPTELVAEHQPVHTMPSYSSSQSNYPGMDVRIVRIEKHPDIPLGATIRIDDDNSSVIVARIVHGGAAQKSGLLHEGDELLEVNGMDLRGKSLEEVCERLGAMKGALTFTILPSQEYSETPVRQNDLHVRANFSYDPDDDPYVEALQCPCPNLGLSFQKRDILHIRNQDDPCWWQAYRDGEELGSVLAGLIPSSEQQQRRHDHSMISRANGPRINGKLIKRDGRKRIGWKKSDKSGKKKRIVNGSPFDLDVGQIPWYEEVGLLNPKPYQKRPIVLIGPAQMGRKELVERLIASDVDRFAKTVAHTTRPKRPAEVAGREYHFVSKHVFDGEILKQRFVEYGLFEKQLYGTSLDSINLVIKSGKVCLLVLEPSAIRSLRAANFKPYVVFIAPPPLDKLQQNRLRMGVPADEVTARRIIEEAEDIEETYGHYIDLVIENVDENPTYTQLLTAINRLERDAQWVPAEWLR